MPPPSVAVVVVVVVVIVVVVLNFLTSLISGSEKRDKLFSHGSVNAADAI